MIFISRAAVETNRSEMAKWKIEAVQGLMSRQALAPNEQDHKMYYVRETACYEECCYSKAVAEPKGGGG